MDDAERYDRDYEEVMRDIEEKQKRADYSATFEAAMEKNLEVLLGVAETVGIPRKKGLRIIDHPGGRSAGLSAFMSAIDRALAPPKR